MELLNSTKCICGKELMHEPFEKLTPKKPNDRFYGGRVAMEGEITCECGRILKGYFEHVYKMGSSTQYGLMDLEIIKDITPEEKIENTPISDVEIYENGESDLKYTIVEEVAPYIPEEYENMKYQELQSICKEKGIKAVGKREDLIAALRGLN